MKKPMTREQFMYLSSDTQYQLYAEALDICLEYQRLTNQLIDLATPPSKDQAPDTQQQRIDLLGILPRP
jgi:hypothetical protein